jgi:hypothetical protein
MKIAGWMKRGCNRLSYRGLALLGGSVLGMAMLAAPQLAAQEQHDSKNQNSIGFNLSKGTDAKDVGLPWYPGARRRQEGKDDSTSVQMGLWGGSTDFKLAVLELDSNDSPDKVAAYYRKSLSKYGKVLDCPGGNAPHEEQDKSKTSKELECDSDKLEKGELELEAGTKEDRHIVGIQEDGTGTRIKLVYLRAKGTEDDK